MEVVGKKIIVASVVTEPGQVSGGGAPIYLARTVDEQRHVAFLLGRILDAMVHDLENGVLVLVKH